MAGAPDANLACAVGRRPCEGFLNETTGTWAGLRCVGGGHPLSRHASATPKTRTWRLLTYEVFPQIGCHEGAVVRVHGVGVRPRPSARPRCVGVRLRTGEVGQVDDKEVEGRAAKAPGRGLFADMRPDPPPQEGGLLGLWHWPWHSASADMSQTPDEKIHVRNAANTEFKIPNWTHTSRHPPRTPVPVPGAPDRGRSAPNQVKKRSDTHGSGIDISGQKKKVERDPGATSWYLPQGPTPTLLRSLTTRTPWSYVVMLVFAPMDLGPARGTPLTQGYSAGVWVSIAGSKEKGTGGPSRQRGLFYCAR